VKNQDSGVMVRTWRRLGETRIIKGYVRCTHFPFVVLTSNREREFPPAFLRRCIRLAVNEPDKDMLGDIVASHFDEATKKQAAGLIQQFLESRASKELATDQLLNAVYLVMKSGKEFDPNEKDALMKQLYKTISGPEAIK
jgi:MoxR-like ATPase